MVLGDLGRRLNTALAELSKVPTVNDAAIDTLLRSITLALLESDVNVKLVSKLRDDVRKQVREALNDPKNEKLNQAQRRSLVQKAIYDHLVALVDPGVEPYKPKKGKPNVIMFVGLQGSGKTTSCTKLALYYQKRGFKTGLVCADTFRAGAFDQLKQNATKAGIPFYGSYSEPDPVTIAKNGVSSFKASRFDIIIVDTSGRHKQELELFNEMMEIQEMVKPDQTIMVLDASIGQAAEGQSKAFKDAAQFGAIFVTKIDGHAKGGGAISAVAATKTPIIFLGVGEHVADLETFKPGPFISKLLGMADLSGLMEMGEEMAASGAGEKQKEMFEKLQKGGIFSIGDWREQVGTIMGMGPLSKMMGMIPGMGQMLGGAQGEEIQSKMKHFIFITDSMTKFELDSDGSCFSAPIKDHHTSKARSKSSEAAMVLAQPEDEEDTNGKGKKKEKPPMRMTARAYRVARGSGTSVSDVENLLIMYRMMRKVMKKMGGAQGMLSQMQNGGKPGAGQVLPPGMSAEQVRAMQNNLPPEIKAQLRQPGGREKLMKDMQSGNIPPGMEGMMMGGGMPGMGGMGGGLGEMMKSMMGGGGAGGGGMPDMSQLQTMMGGMGGGGMAEMMKQFTGMGGGMGGGR